MSAGNAPLTRVVLITGLSGAGKASILRALEDLGYEAVDNTPLPLIDVLVTRQDGPVPPGGRRIAVGVDARTRGFDANAVLATIARLRETKSLRPELLYAWAEEAILQRRYTESRRRHPLSPHGKVSDGIRAELLLTAQLREAADHLIDTSDHSLASLRQLLEGRFSSAPSDGRVGLSVSLVSFAFPAGLPREADMVFDVRFLLNPHYVTELQFMTGIDGAVGAYIESDPDYQPFFGRLTDMLGALLPRFVQEGKKYVTIAIGCTGGRHRSVFTIERLAEHLARSGWRVTVNHRELARETAGLPGEVDKALTQTASPHVQAQEA